MRGSRRVFYNRLSTQVPQIPGNRKCPEFECKTQDIGDISGRKESTVIGSGKQDTT